MGIFDHFPYTNFHELNLDWILRMLKEIDTTIDQFVAINALKYADPIQWSITSQYERNTIVIDPQTGTAYISVSPVPVGVAITNPDYWTVVFDLGSFVTRAAKNLANRYEADSTTTATFNTPAGNWLVWGDTLYRALVNITAGDSYIVDGNIKRFTMEDVIGHLTDLIPVNRNNLVEAINWEVENRRDADGDLQTAINTETTNRQNADGALQTAIDTERTNRQNADGALNTRIDNILPSVQTAIESKESKLRDRHFLFIGDSYDVIVPDYHWSTIAANALGITHYTRRSTGGYGFAPNNNATWKSLLQNNPVEDAANITDIVIGGGTNDSSSTNNIAAAMADFDAYIRATFPKLERVYLGYMGWSHLNATQKTQHRGMYGTYLGNAKKLGWHFMNGVQYVLRNPVLILTGLADRVHPNADGVTRLGESVAEAILTGFSSIYMTLTSTFTPNSDKVTGNTFNIAQIISNQDLEFTTPDVTLTAATALSGNFVLATCPDLGSAINQYKYWMTYVSFGGNIYPAILTSFNTNELTLWLRGGITIPSGTSFQIGGFTYNDLS